MIFLLAIIIIQILPTVLFASAAAVNNLTIVQTPDPEYVRLLNHSILFYEAQRSGKLPNDNRLPWRHDSCLTDGSDVKLDLTGGYYDAGDYLKFTFPLSYTVFMLSWGGTEYFEGYKLANQTNYLKNQLKWATDWMIKAHPQECTLYVQVGDVQLDNNYFGPDTGIPLPRPSYQINETHFGTEAASMAATAFATASSFFHVLASETGDESNTAYANVLLLHATKLYNCSQSIEYTRYQSSVPTVKDVYASTNYLDDLILSSIALYKSTNNQSYLDDALGLYQLSDWRTNHTEPLDWDNKYGAVYVLLAEALFNISEPDMSLQRRIDAENYLDGMVNNTTVNQTKGGLLFWDYYSDDNSNSNAMSASYLLLYYSAKILRPLLSIPSTDKESISAKIESYEELANKQLNYIFGMNPIQQNYVVGERDNSPKYPHSALSAGFSSLAEAIANPTDLSHSHTIYGAIVGGPAKNDSFTDQRLDWSQTEVALDYNACYQGILAYQVMHSTQGPFYESLPNVTQTSGSNLDNQGSHSLPRWALAIAILLPILFFVLLVLSVFLFVRRRSKAKRTGDEGSTVYQGNMSDKKTRDITHQ
ncbi:hypothetical protein G6F44_000919 [Rhizopus delemar]|nr:hypothetical protein G6F44_000919 [Rhizopus delemar]